MTVNASSVISTAINTFDSELYDSITSMENNQYVAGGQTKYLPLFQDLSGSIVSWMNTDRSGKIVDLIQGLYSYKLFIDMYSTDNTLISTSDADILMGMNGFRVRVRTDAVTYYDDYPTLTFATTTITRDVGSWVDDGFLEGMGITIAGTTSSNGSLTIESGGVSALVLTITDGTSESNAADAVITGAGSVRMSTPNMSTDKLLIGGSFDSQEDPNTDALISGYTLPIKGKIFVLLFSDVPPNPSLTKDQMNTYIFDTLNYRTVFDNLNTGTHVAPEAP